MPIDVTANEAAPLDAPEGVSGKKPGTFRKRIAKFIAILSIATVLLTIGWLYFFVPVARSAEPITPPRIELLTRQGEPFASEGPLIDKPVKVRELPDHVAQAFYAIEDRRFRSHWGVDPIGLARAVANNLLGRGRQGGSTITQQLAKNVYLLNARTGAADATMVRKAKEMAIAFWLESHLTKDQILERYLSNVAFGQNIYGLRAASLHYFYRQPERLTVPQAIMLAGLVQSPSRLDPRKHLERAQKRAGLVRAAMVRDGYLEEAEAAKIEPAKLDMRFAKPRRTGNYFADWVLPGLREDAGRSYSELRFRTTLDSRLQALANAAVRKEVPGAPLVALVAMRRNGEVVALYGGRDYAASQFNLATLAKRQPGSTFKLFTYLAAMQQGMRPDDRISNARIETGSYRPKNADGRYGGAITLREAFAKSSNVASLRLFEQVGANKVIATARDLGVDVAAQSDASLALGTADVSLLKMTAAYAAIAAGTYPVEPTGLPVGPPGWYEELFGGPRPFDRTALDRTRQLLAAVILEGTGRSAALSVPAWGKTGTSQDNRDAWFIGYAGNLVVGVWLGRGDGAASAGATGGGAAARLWRRFMQDAVDAGLHDPGKPEAVDTDSLVTEVEGMATGADAPSKAPAPLPNASAGDGNSLPVRPPVPAALPPTSTEPRPAGPVNTVRPAAASSAAGSPTAAAPPVRPGPAATKAASGRTGTKGNGKATMRLDDGTLVELELVE